MKTSETNSYYGIFFWLSLITFVVPFFVAYRAFDQLRPTDKPVASPDASGVDHRLWDYLLRSYVENGRIDYQAMNRDYVFKEYLAELARAEPDALKTDHDKLALYLNAYNAFVVQGVVNHKINKSVKEFRFDGRGFFDQQEHILASQTLSLNRLEDDLIRVPFRDPRIHMAIVCAAESCPVIRREAYVGDRLESQLEDQARLFCNNEKHVFYDEASNKIMVNSILDWYGRDFEEQGGFLKWIHDRVEDENLKTHLQSALDKKLEVDFIKYDWSLNSQSPGASSTPIHTEAGSGTIPNQ